MPRRPRGEGTRAGERLERRFNMWRVHVAIPTSDLLRGNSDGVPAGRTFDDAAPVELATLDHQRVEHLVHRCRVSLRAVDHGQYRLGDGTAYVNTRWSSVLNLLSRLSSGPELTAACRANHHWS